MLIVYDIWKYFLDSLDILQLILAVNDIFYIPRSFLVSLNFQLYLLFFLSSFSWRLMFLGDNSVSLSAEIKNALGENASLLPGAYGFSLRLFVGPVAL